MEDERSDVDSVVGIVVGEMGEVRFADDWVVRMDEEVGSWVLEEETANGLVSFGGDSIVLFFVNVSLKDSLRIFFVIVLQKKGNVSRRINIYPLNPQTRHQDLQSKKLSLT